MWREVCGGHSRTQSVCVGPSKYGLCPPTQRVKSEVSDQVYSLFPQQTGNNEKNSSVSQMCAMHKGEFEIHHLNVLPFE